MAERTVADETAHKIVSRETGDECSHEKDLYFADSLDEETAVACTSFTASDDESTEKCRDENDTELDNLIQTQTAHCYLTEC